ncbi:MAG: DUF3034 family protein [Pseudohongiellaceae bacterium]|nr:DUF3034 family protein [Pseudohongiellaceae bacterium]
MTIVKPLTAATLFFSLCVQSALAQDGRIKGTGGVNSISGAGGGGLIPWATLSSHASAQQDGGTLFATRTNVDDFSLDVIGLSASFKNRLEFSLARQEFTIKANNAQIEQDIIGVKLRVAGDLIFGNTPQLSIGAERHSLRDPATAFAVGAREDNGTDYYISAARAWINGPFHRTTMLNINARYSRANQYGILGYSGDEKDGAVALELAAAMFITRSWVIGAEFRQKPDNLSALKEDSARDIFVAWLPSKRWSVTAAYVDLGDIAGAADQTGYYLSLQGTF